MIEVIGTSHVAKQSLYDLKEAFQKFLPDLVAVELDRQRLQGLLSKQKSSISFSSIFKVGFTGFLFALIGSYVQKKIGSTVGVMPGSDMLQAVKLAKKDKLLLALVDQDISITLSRLSKVFTWREKFRLIGDLFKGVFFQKRELRRLGLEHIDLSKVPDVELIEKLMGELKSRYPNIYRVLVVERNQVMIKNILHLQKHYPDKKILVVVGAGHLKEVKDSLRKQHL